MPSPLPSRVLRQLIGSVSDLHAVHGSESFAERSIRTSNAIVQGEINVYTEIDPAAGRVVLLADRGHTALAAVEADFLRLQHQHPGIQRQVRLGEFGVTTISKRLTNREWKSLDLYNDVYRKMGVEDQVVIAAPVPAPLALGVTISRDRRGFRSAEILALEHYQQHFVRAYRAEQRFADQRQLASVAVGAEGDGGKGFVIASHAGEVQLASPRAESLLEKYFPLRRSRPRALPGRISDRLLRLSAMDESRLLESNVLRATRGSDELRIDICRDARLDRWTLSLEEKSERERRRAEAERFSPRLQTVLHGLLDGQSEKEIAHRLGLAPTTVHDYVKQIFRRLHVHSRPELMALWIQER